MKRIISFVMCFSVTACLAQPVQPPSSITKERVGNVLSCLQTALSPLDAAPPHFTQKSYSVRYYYGVLTPGDEDSNELSLVVYGPDEETATVYWVYFEDEDQKKTILIGQWGTLKKDAGAMSLDEVPGGLASQAEDLKILKAISSQKALAIDDSDVKPGLDICSYPPAKFLQKK